MGDNKEDKRGVEIKKDMVLGSVADRKPTINSLRKENGLSEIPDGDVVLTTKNSMATGTKDSSFPLRGITIDLMN